MWESNERAFGVGDARIAVERGFFGALGLVDFERRFELRDVVVVELQVAGERAEFGGIGQAGVRIFGGDFGQFDGRLHHVRDAFGARDRRCRTSPVRLPIRTRIPAPREPASFRFSTSRMRTLAENSSPSEMVHSASVAPAASACLTMSGGEFQQVVAAQAVPPTVIRSILTVGMPTPTGTLCPSLPQMPMPSSSLQIVAHHADVLQRFGAVADQRGVAHRARELAVLDQVAFGRREDEIAAGDIHLAAAEVGAVEALGDGADDLFGIALAGQHEGVGHARHGDVLRSFRGGRCRWMRCSSRRLESLSCR